MRKALAAIAILAMIAGTAHAGFHISQEELTIANFLDAQTVDLHFGGVLSVFDVGRILSVDIGLITPGTGLAICGGASLNLLQATKKLGWNYNLPDPINIGIFGARDFERKNNIYGVYFGITWGPSEPKYGTGTGDRWSRENP
jgi:hypothetical protein